MSATAVLDVGKTNIKIVIFGVDGAVLWEKTAANAALPGPPYRHADTDAIWQFALDALGQAARQHAIDQIVTTAHGACGAVVDDQGLVLPVLDYEDTAPEEIEADYAKIRPPFAQTLSGPGAGGLNLGRQLAYQKWRFPREFAKARHVLTYPQFWSWKFSGIAASEVTSLGTHTDLWLPAECRFSSLPDALGIAALFPPLRPAWDVLGPITADIAARTGLKRATRVLNGIHDSNASLLPNLSARQAAFTVVSSGTWVIILKIGSPPGPLDQQSDLFANVDVTGRPVPCARFMGGREYAAIAGAEGHPDMAAISRVIASGTLALPSFAGNAGPYASRAGRIAGPIAVEDRPALATLYIALMTDDLLTRLEAGHGDIVIEGSFGKNAAYCALLAALRPDQKIAVSADQSGTARGAALLAHWPAPPTPDNAHIARPAAGQGLMVYRDAWHEALGHG